MKKVEQDGKRNMDEEKLENGTMPFLKNDNVPITNCAMSSIVDIEQESDEKDDCSDALAAAGATTAEIMAREISNEGDSDRIIDLESLEVG